MEFITVEKGRYLTAPTMTDIYNNFNYLCELLENNGYPVGVIEILDNSADYATSPADILGKMNAVESNIQAIHKIIDWYDEYFKEFEWEAYTENKKKEVERWINWLNDVYLTLSGEQPKLLPLADIDGDLIKDVNGNQIYVYLEYCNLCDTNGIPITDSNGKQILISR